MMQPQQLATHPFPISDLMLDCLFRDYYGSFDALVLAQLAPLVDNECYQPKIYRAPSLAKEVLDANGYTSFGLKITPGSIIYGFYLPPADNENSVPASFVVQITDTSLKHDWWDQPISSYFLGNNQPGYVSASQADVNTSFPNLLDAPYPVVGTGLFSVQIWNRLDEDQRIELVLGVLEPAGEACL